MRRGVQDWKKLPPSYKAILGLHKAPLNPPAGGGSSKAENLGWLEKGYVWGQGQKKMGMGLPSAACALSM